ncbi:MAG: hypothetical protein OXH52_05955 [Gammaproteobacteria bacterium]|nr:hypothetical protein [Gammaproteobacteria bacterium]
MLRVDDPPSGHSTAIQAALVRRRAALAARNVAYTELGADLLATDQRIADVFHTAVGTLPRRPSALWLDISSMPKRYFFLWLKLALNSADIETVLVTYSQPTPGGYVDAHLAEDPEDLRPLPGYTSIVEPSTLVVAVGFESLGLPQFLSEYRDRQRRIVVFIPFPPGQPYAQRIWQTVQRLGLSTVGPDSRRVATLDAFETVRQLDAVLAGDQATADRREQVSVALAPYGPKPVSLGMCLFAMERDAAVFYTQPRSYHPAYTSGTGPSWGYLLKFGGRRLKLE